MDVTLVRSAATNRRFDRSRVVPKPPHTHLLGIRSWGDPTREPKTPPPPRLVVGCGYRTKTLAKVIVVVGGGGGRW